MTTNPASTDGNPGTLMSTADRDAALLAAYTALMTETGRRPGVRALRERARTSTGAAATWLKEHAPERRAPEIPVDALAPVLSPLWAAAVDAATQALQDDHRAALAEHLESEVRALAAVEQVTAQAEQQAGRATVAENRADELAREIHAARQDAERGRQQARNAEQVAVEIRERSQAAVHEAEQAAAVAQAEAAAFREALAAVRPDTDLTQEVP